MIVEIDGLNINYMVIGNGQDVILLHGWGAESSTFQRLQGNLAQYLRVYALDLPGFGKSSTPLFPWGVSDYSNLLKEFISKMGINNPVLLGHSFGGRVSIKYVSTYKNVKKLILVDSAGVKPKRKPIYYIRVYAYKSVKFVLNLPVLRLFSARILVFMKTKLGSSDYRQLSGIMQQTFVKVVNEDLKKFMPLIDCPTLLIWGENDQATPLSDGKIMERLIPDAGLVVLNGAGHFAYIDKIREFLIIVSKFLEKEMRNA